MQQIRNHYEKQLNSLSLDYEQFKKKKTPPTTTTGILYQNDIWLIESFIMVLLSCRYPFYSMYSSNEKRKKKEYQK